MPVVRFRGREIACERGENLREVLQRAGLTPHNGLSRWVNCRGFGSCGACAVHVEGELAKPTLREWIRLRLPPHRSDSGLRLACQARILGDLVVEKWDGFWGQRRP